MKSICLKTLSLMLVVCLLACLWGCEKATQDGASSATSGSVSGTSTVSTGDSSGTQMTAPDITVSYNKVSSSASTGVTSSSTAATLPYTPSTPDPKYAFDGSMSFEVLNRYLDRAMTFSALYWQGDLDEHIRMFKNLGIKYVPRVSAEWCPSSFEQESGDKLKAMVEKIHYADPDIIVEGCIFECVNLNVEMIKVPTFVQEAFGQTVQKNRYFDLEKMIFPDGYGKNQWGTGAHVPDITQVETQMFFYTRACEYIDLGYESIHLGQANMIGHNDKNNACWTKVIKMIREYAKKNARRHYVMINAHTDPTKAFVGTDGVMLVDFNAYPVRMFAAEGQTDHAVSEDNPQKCTIGNHIWPDIYKSGIGGKSPSGWYTDKYPYLVEFDNGGINEEILNKATHTFGYDEISWYAYQPYSYRKEFMTYLYEEIASFKENGHIALPGSRGLAKSESVPGGIYFANSKAYLQKGWGDEGFFKELLQKYAKWR